MPARERGMRNPEEEIVQLDPGTKVRLFFGGPVMEVVERLVDERGLPGNWVLCVEAVRQAEFGVYRARDLQLRDGSVQR